MAWAVEMMFKVVGAVSHRTYYLFQPYRSSGFGKENTWFPRKTCQKKIAFFVFSTDFATKLVGSQLFVVSLHTL